MPSLGAVEPWGFCVRTIGSGRGGSDDRRGLSLCHSPCLSFQVCLEAPRCLDPFSGAVGQGPGLYMQPSSQGVSCKQPSLSGGALKIRHVQQEAFGSHALRIQSVPSKGSVGFLGEGNEELLHVLVPRPSGNCRRLIQLQRSAQALTYSAPPRIHWAPASHLCANKL